MALINCSECGREVSDKAASCPGCGAPVAVAVAPAPAIQQPQATAESEVVTTQLTSQNLKAQQAFAVVIMLIGLMFLFTASGSGGGRVIGIVATLIGLIWLVIVKMQTWWRHS